MPLSFASFVAQKYKSLPLVRQFYASPVDYQDSYVRNHGLSEWYITMIGTQQPLEIVHNIGAVILRYTVKSAERIPGILLKVQRSYQVEFPDCPEIYSADYWTAKENDPKWVEDNARWLTPNRDMETYQVVALSTGHLSAEDIDVLTRLSKDTARNMILGRDTGFIVKLYAPDPGEPDPQSNYDQDYSESLVKIVRWATSQGFQMIEFDADAPALSEFPVYEDAMA